MKHVALLYDLTQTYHALQSLMYRHAGTGFIIYSNLFVPSQSFVELAGSDLTQHLKLVKGIRIPANRCDTVYSMGNMINPFMLQTSRVKSG